MKNWEGLLSRRQFISKTTKRGAVVLLAAHLLEPQQLVAATKGQNTNAFLKTFGPMDRTKADYSPKVFTGDHFERPHQILWDLPSYFTTHQPEGKVEEAPVVIIGGGVSGLFSAYSLRKHKPVVLEQAPRFGGNAKGESWRGMDYAIGAAYLDEPFPGTPMDDYFRELKLKDLLVQRSSSDPVEYNGKLYEHFWEGETEPKHVTIYQKISIFFEELCHEKERAFPFIPSLNPKHLESVKYYDKYDLHSLLTKVAGEKLPERLETAFEYYCWSTYAASSKEISASAALNFLAQESRPIYVPAGGNARVAERVLQKTLETVPSKNFRTSCIVVSVKVTGDSVLVLYEDPQGKLKQIRSKVVVMSCPKFIAAKILEGMESERRQTISKLKYRSYLTANLLLKKRVKGNFYDLFMIGKGKADLSNVCHAQAERNATDFVLANFASPSDKFSVLTFYRAFPCDGMRKELMMPESYDKYRAAFEKQITEEILPLVGAKASEIVDLRLTRWGHALPVSAKGIYSDGSIEQLRAPFKQRVFFIEQDNWAYPSTQTGATEIALIQKDIEKVLGSA